MELEITAAKEGLSSKKSIALKPTDQGTAKIILVRHYISPFSKKEKKMRAPFTEVDIPSKAHKRKSLELVDSEEIDKQNASAKRRRTVQLLGFKGTSKTLAPVEQNETVTQHSGVGVSDNVTAMGNNTKRTNGDRIHALHMQCKNDCQLQTEISPSIAQGNKSLERDNLQHNEWENVHYEQDAVLLPEDWSDERYEDNLLDFHTLELNVHKSLFSISGQESTQVKNNAQCKSLFATYHFSKVQKSIVDEQCHEKYS